MYFYSHRRLLVVCGFYFTDSRATSSSYVCSTSKNNVPTLCVGVCVWYVGDVSIMTQIIKRPGEGIAATDGAGRSEKARVICTVRFG